MKNLLKSLIILIVPFIYNTSVFSMEAEQPEYEKSIFGFPQYRLANLIDYERSGNLTNELLQLNQKQLEDLLEELVRLLMADQQVRKTYIEAKVLGLSEIDLQKSLIRLRGKLVEAINAKQVSVPMTEEELQLQEALKLSKQEYEKEKQAKRAVSAEIPVSFSNHSNQLVTIMVPRNQDSWYPISLIPQEDYDKSIPRIKREVGDVTDVIVFTFAGEFWVEFAGNNLSLTKKVLRDSEIKYDEIPTITTKNGFIIIIINPDGSVTLAERG